MGPRLVPLTIGFALLSLAAAAMAAGLMVRDPRWWAAAVHLAVLGGLVPMIYAVNIRIVPVFARRMWPKPRMLQAQIATALPGAVLAAAGIRAGNESIKLIGSLLALAGGLLFLANLITLFRQPAGASPPLPLPFPEQAAVDRIATQFSKLSGVFLVFGLAVGVALSVWTPDSGRWELVWAHAVLLGGVVSMAAAITYHVLPRWGQATWRSIGLIRLHLLLTVVALPGMLIALATDFDWLFHFAGPAQTVALLVWFVNVLPATRALPSPTRQAVWIAFGFLAIGISLGSAFAIDAYYGAIYRQVHAELNLFGWAGLLVLGVGYYLLPRFASKPMRWPRLAPLQIGVIATAVFVNGIFLRIRASGDGDLSTPILISHAALALGLLSFAVQAIATFRSQPGSNLMMPSTAPRPRMPVQRARP
jgi:hypothetical protein